MQLRISHEVKEPLVLPLNYQYFIQSIIYRNIGSETEYSAFLHDKGFSFMDRQYRMFVFSLLEGKYEISQGKIIFRDYVSFEVRSPEVNIVRLLKENLEQNGINYLGQHYDNIQLELLDRTITSDTIKIRMKSPICVYSTEEETKKTIYFSPNDEDFAGIVGDNFIRKYYAYKGIIPETDILLKPIRVTQKDKFVTKYKGIYVSGWKGIYELYGEPKYLDFLYQTGIGSKNAQGFGLFDIV